MTLEGLILKVAWLCESWVSRKDEGAWNSLEKVIGQFLQAEFDVTFRTILSLSEGAGGNV